MNTQAEVLRSTLEESEKLLRDRRGEQAEVDAAVDRLRGELNEKERQKSDLAAQVASRSRESVIKSRSPGFR